MQRIKRRLNVWRGREGSISKIEKIPTPLPVGSGCVGELEVRLTVWLCMIRSRLPALQSRIFDEINSRRAGYKIERPYAPIDRIMRVWMEDILYENKLIQTSDSRDCKALPTLCVLIELMLQEASTVRDYRAFFIFLMDRINVYVEHLVRGIIPSYGVGLDKANSLCMRRFHHE
jgi:hypothetical protein